MEKFDHILLFKTDIRTQQDKLRVGPALDNSEGVAEWNVDLDDEDCVLRIISPSLKTNDIIQLVTANGYQCGELV